MSDDWLLDANDCLLLGDLLTMPGDGALINGMTSSWTARWLWSSPSLSKSNSDFLRSPGGGGVSGGVSKSLN
eukprot:CAMPEP_0169269648 /NCGR_PEP_ID=MMETSP1016-20121227/48586_1 /TAXON_ID=342587 /ORGANISM="Karlodinium micrum, Strain CCMP2283" /LENGTH=71 /DNA_ID=CAMNT_0009354721 /DNA_START=87 /DNA_END=302 /DNA_ORIENTATION=+